MRISLTLPTIIISASLLGACTLRDCEKGVGAVVRKPLSIDPITGISVQGSMDVRLHRSATQEVEVEAQPNLAALLVTEVRNGIWRISTSKCYTTNEPFIVHIGLPTIAQVSVQGSGDVKGSDSFTVPEFTVDVQGSGEVEMTIESDRINAAVQGSGDIHLNGTCGDLTASVQGSGDIDAGALRTKHARAEIAGSGDITVDATDHLEAQVAGSGDVKYRTKPARLDQSISGSGGLKAVE